MLNFFIILLILQIVNTSAYSQNTSLVDKFLDKLQGKRFQQAQEILKNITEIEVLHEISINLFEKQHDPLIKLMFFSLINNNNYKWLEALNSEQIIKLWQAFKLDLKLLDFKITKNFLKDLEFTLIQKCALHLKCLIIQKNFKDFEMFTLDLSSLPKDILHKTVKLSLTKTYGLILHSKLLKRLNLHTNLNVTKILYFIEFYKELKAQKALNLNLCYKLALSLRYLLENFCVYDQQIKLQLINLKQSLPSNILLIVFSQNVCLSPENLKSYFLASCQGNLFNLTLAINDNSVWLSFIFENKLILESKSNNFKIFINYNHKFSDNFNEYHLKPLTATDYILVNSVTNKILCQKNAATFWQNYLDLDKTNCLWIINNCTSLKRFLVNEYN